jgi:parallel beta-helix repeat protein
MGKKGLVVMLIVNLLFFVTVLHVANAVSIIPISTQLDTSVLLETEARIGGGRIERAGNTFKFTGDVSEQVTVESGDVTIDGDGYALKGDGEGCGLLIKQGNVTVKNLRIEGFDVGVCASTFNISLVGNTIKNSDVGVKLECLDDSKDFISGNYIVNNRVGVLLCSNASTFIAGNQIAQNHHGIEFAGASKNSQIIQNNFEDNAINVEFLEVSAAVCRESFGPVAWDDGAAGNYWSDYKSQDSNGDGKGNLLYVIVSKDPNVAYCRDRFPLMAPAEVAVKTPSFAELDALQYGNNVSNPYAAYITFSIVGVQLVAIALAVMFYRKKRAQRRAEDLEAAKRPL